MKFIFLFIDQLMTQKTYIAMKNEEETRYLLPEQKQQCLKFQNKCNNFVVKWIYKSEIHSFGCDDALEKNFVSPLRFWIFQNNPLIVAVVTAQQQPRPQQQNNQNCSWVETK